MKCLNCKSWSKIDGIEGYCLYNPENVDIIVVGVDTTKNKPKLITTEDFYCKDYEEEKKHYFLITIDFCSGEEYESFHILAHCSDAKVIDQISDYFNYDFEKDNFYLTPYGNAYKFAGYQTISEEDFNVLSKYLDVIGGKYE